MSRLRWLITVPVAVIVVVFAVNNRSDVDVDLWPLDIIIAWPLFVFIFIGLGIGFPLGAVLIWFSGAPARKRARERTARIRELERHIAQDTPTDTPRAITPQPPARTG